MKSPPDPPLPIRRVSAGKYPQAEGLFAVRMRVKGEADGPVFRGQTVIVPCAGCGAKRRAGR